jgi:hypothetical protein
MLIPYTPTSFKIFSSYKIISWERSWLLVQNLILLFTLQFHGYNPWLLFIVVYISFPDIADFVTVFFTFVLLVFSFLIPRLLELSFNILYYIAHKHCLNHLLYKVLKFLQLHQIFLFYLFQPLQEQLYHKQEILFLHYKHIA